jgi:hypothetical protein
MRWYAEVSTFSRQTTLADSLHHQGREQITAHIVLAVFSAPFVLERDMIAGQVWFETVGWMWVDMV